MGNQPSSGDGGNSRPATSRFLRTTGLLGLSKAELDVRCKPSGLYPSCNWEDKAIRKLIGDGKLAARLRGTENRSSPTDRECPICFLQYKEVNTTKCCTAYICTECYLQVRPQKTKSNNCPFCNHNKFAVTVAQAMNAEAMLAREETEQRFIEAKIRERAQNAEAAAAKSQEASFGSSLQKDERIATLRARSSSLSDSCHESAEGATIPEDVLRESFAMTPEERRMLEDEMRAQHSHPLSLRLEAEAEERRISNEQEFLRQNPTQVARSSRSRRGRGSERRNWNQIVEAFERGGHGEVNSLDDLVVLEAAMILSMEEESRRRGPNAAASSTASTPSEQEFDANRHASDGFPLVRSILSGRQEGSTEQSEQLQSLANSLYTRRRSRNSLMRAYGGGGGTAPDNTTTSNMQTAMDTAGLLMRGISEDDQMAMAIAASLQDQQQQQPSAEDGGGAEGDGDGAEESNSGAASETSDAIEPAADGEVAAAPVPVAAAAPEGGADASNSEEQSGEVAAAAESEPAEAAAEVAEAESEVPATEPAVAAETFADTEETAATETEEAEAPKEEAPAAAAALPDSLDAENHGQEALN